MPLLRWDSTKRALAAGPFSSRLWRLYLEIKFVDCCASPVDSFKPESCDLFAIDIIPHNLHRAVQNAIFLPTGTEVAVNPVRKVPVRRPNIVRPNFRDAAFPVQGIELWPSPLLLGRHLKPEG